MNDLSADRIGDRVLLHWTTPAKTTDGLDIRGAMTAEICRSEGRTSGPVKKPLPACVTVQRLATAPGASTATDTLPPALLTDPVVLLTYRIQILNSSGRSAGRFTTAAYAAGGAAPSPVDSLTASASEAGAVLRWKQTESGKQTGSFMQTVAGEPLVVDFARIDLTTPAAAGRDSGAAALQPSHRGGVIPNRKQGKPEAPLVVHLQAAASSKPGADSAGTVDTTAVMGANYRYVAQTVRPVEVEGHLLEIRSVPSSAVTLAMRDTFAPKSPSGLASIPGATEAADGARSAPYIDLSWEPNTEPDLAGYFVYRQLARPNGDPQGPLGKLTSSPIASPAYRDVAVVPGQRYIYSVSAVDASGNESAPSAKAQEVASAQSVDPPWGGDVGQTSHFSLPLRRLRRSISLIPTTLTRTIRE